MVLPHEPGEQRDAEQAGDGEPVAPERLTREHRQQLEHDREARQGEDVHLRVAEDPEQVLVQVVAAPGGRQEEVCLHRPVERLHREDRDQHRSCEHHEQRRRDDAPDEDREARPRQTRSTHRHDRGDHVQAQQRHRDPDQGEEEDVVVHPRVALVRERRVARPAGGEAAEEDRRRQDRAGRHQEPERERLDTWEGHPPRADHDRDQVVGERAEDRARHDPHHHRAVQADDRQVRPCGERLVVRAEQLGADQHRVQAADEEEQPDPPQVLDADDLVVGAEPEVARPAVRLLLAQRRRVAEQAT